MVVMLLRFLIMTLSAQMNEYLETTMGANSGSGTLGYLSGQRKDRCLHKQ